MKTETASDNVYSALLRARAEFAPVVKGKTNPHFKSRYADLETVLDAVSEPLARQGLVLIQAPDVTAEGIVLVTSLVWTGSQEKISCRYPIVPAKPNDPQALASAITYARRYSALALLGIAPEDDDGNAASSNKTSQQQTPAKQPQAAQQAGGKPQGMDDSQREELDRLTAALNIAPSAFAKRIREKYGVANWHDLTHKQADEIISSLEDRLTKQQEKQPA